MALDASDFPQEGQNFNSERLLPSVDEIIRNSHIIQRNSGIAKPEYVPDFGALAMMNAQGAQNAAELPQPVVENDEKSMPGENVVPDIPKAVQNRMADHPTTNPYAFNIPINRQPTPIPRKEEITYFKDSLGNEYKTIGEKLYVLGWQDSDVKIRIISEKNGKEISSEGKRFQIYGWHLVKKVTDSAVIEKNSKIDVVDEKLSSVRVEPKAETANESSVAAKSTVANETVKTETETVRKTKKAKRLA